MIAHARNGCISTSGLKSDIIVFLDPRFPVGRENFGDSRTFEADIGFAWISRTSWSWGFWGKIGEGVVR